CPLAITGKAGASDPVRMPDQLYERFTRHRVPDPRSFVERAGNDPPPIGRIARIHERIVMPHQGHDLAPGQVPHPHSLVTLRRDRPGSIEAEHGAFHCAGVTVEKYHLLTRCGVPNTGSIVV